jgi:DNA polymerase I-like protein with 3'-5' exonuclease and polymerase domains
MKVVFDCETSRYPDGSPYRPSAELISHCTYFPDEKQTNFSYYTDADFTQRLRDDLSKASLVIGLNLKFDVAWARRTGVCFPNRCRVWDCQLAEFILSGQTNSFSSMDDLCSFYGIPGKQGGLEEYWDQGIETKEIPYDVVKEYNIADVVDRTYQIYLHQLKDPRMTPALYKLILIQGADLLVLQEMEQNGFKYNKEKSITKGNELKLRVEEIENELRSIFGCHCANFDSGDDLSVLLYGGQITETIYGKEERVYKSGPRKGESYTRVITLETKVHKFDGYFKPLPKTQLKKSLDLLTGKPNPNVAQFYQTGEPVLKMLAGRSKVQKRIIDLILERAEYSKLVDTYLLKLPVRMEENEWGDYIHGAYNQVVARTGRLSSSGPNMQNVPSLVDGFFESRYD